jgi:hypothetical protein
MTREDLRGRLMELLEGMASGVASWQAGEVEAVADYILARGGVQAARELVEAAEMGEPVVNRLSDWINAWHYERNGTARSRMERVYLRAWEWKEVEEAVQALLRYQTAHSQAAALGYLALIGARVIREEGLDRAVSWLTTRS